MVSLIYMVSAVILIALVVAVDAFTTYGILRALGNRVLVTVGTPADVGGRRQDVRAFLVGLLVLAATIGVIALGMWWFAGR